MDPKLRCMPSRCPSRSTENHCGLSIYRENLNKIEAHAILHIGERKNLFAMEDLT